MRKIADKRAKLELLTAVTGHDAVKSHIAEHKRNRDAQGRAFRKSIGEGDVAEESDVGHTILGDIHQPPVIVTGQQQPQQSSGFKSMLLGAGLTAIGGPIAGAAGVYLYNKLTQDTKPAPIVEPVEPIDTDTTVQIRLGKEGE